MHPAADSGIFALGVLAHDDPVELAAVHVAQRRRDPRQHAGRTHVGVLIERLADREAQAPERDVVGDFGMPGRAEQDRIVVADQIAAILRHHAAVLLVVLAAPVEVVEPDFETALALGERGERLDAGGDDLCADAVAGNGRNCVGFHVGLPDVVKMPKRSVRGDAAPSI